VRVESSTAITVGPPGAGTGVTPATRGVHDHRPGGANASSGSGNVELVRWDPTQYARYAGPRARPFLELVTRIDADAPDRVVDLGCGPGDQTVTLRQRWPEADIVGIDSSAEMIERTPADAGVTFAQGDANAFDATGLDVLVSNALLQWVPQHHALLQRWAGQINAGGWLAFQVPDNFDAPSHALMRELAESATWADRLSGVLRSALSVSRPAEYLELLSGAGLAVDVWQTEYLHVLEGPDPVLEWVRGTGLRPVLVALDAEDAAAYESEYAALLRDAYPARALGTVFPFRRTFVVGHRS
jgi:trans-aconitate 2-methyltransferase